MIELFDASPIPDSDAVKQLLVENPGSELIICIAGCRGAGVPTVMMKRPSKITPNGFTGVLDRTVAIAGASVSDTAASDQVVCLAGCVGDSGAIVFRGRQHAWIRQDGRDSLAAAMTDFAARIASTDHHGSSPERAWVSLAARATLAAFSITLSDGALSMAPVR